MVRLWQAAHPGTAASPGFMHDVFVRVGGTGFLPLVVFSVLFALFTSVTVCDDRGASDGPMPIVNVLGKA